MLQDLVYEHPQYTPDPSQPRPALGELGDSRLAFAGAYHGWGFHEDGAASGVRAAAQLGREWEAPVGRHRSVEAEQPAELVP